VEQLHIPVGRYVFSARADGPADGRLVVLLHGFPQSSAQWKNQLPALAGAGYRAVAPDQRGYSPGARPDGVAQYRIEHLVADVLAMVDEMGGHRFDVVGHDWGAGVAWHLAARYPERLRTLTAVSVPHPAALSAAMRGAEQAARSAYIGFFRQEGMAERMMLAKDGAGLQAMLTASGLPGPEAEEYATAMAEEGALTAALNWYRAATVEDAAGLGPVSVPTLFVWSDKDVAIGQEAAEGCADHVEGPYRFEVLEGVSHWIPETAPDELNRLLLDHLSAWD
jgi:pimeloyl-ACP methyl ester carboxylesterase